MSVGDRMRLSRLRAATRHEQQRKATAPTDQAASGLVHIYQKTKTFLLNVIGVFVAVTIVLYLYDDISKRSISIVKLSVPKSLADKGLTQEAVTANLHQALLAIEKAAGSKKRSANVVDSSDKITIEVPTTGMSLDMVSDAVRKLLRISSGWKINGFVVEVPGSYVVNLSLKDGNRSEMVVIPSRSANDLDYEAAAIKIFEAIEPYILAAYYYGKDDKRSEELAKSILDGDASDETKSLCHNLIGNIYNDHLGQHEEAATAYLNAIRFDGRNEIAYNGLGNAYLFLGRYDDAIRAYQNATRLAPHYSAAYHRMGEAYARKSLATEARTHFEKALAENPANDLAWADLGRLQAKAGEFDAALASIRKAIDIEPDDQTHKRLLASTLRKAGREQEADAMVRALGTGGGGGAGGGGGSGSGGGSGGKKP